MRQNLRRLLAAALGSFLALSLGRSAAALQTAETERARLQTELAEKQAEFRQMEEQTETVRQWAERQGLVLPEDIVFFDGGAWRAGDGRSSQK